MSRLNPHEMTLMFLALGTLLLRARVLGEVACSFGLPSVIGFTLVMLTVVFWLVNHLLAFVQASTCWPCRSV